MDIIIFNILFLFLIGNALVLPFGALVEYAYAFITRSELTAYSLQWQDMKYGGGWMTFDDWGEEVGRWLVLDLLLGFVTLVLLAMLGSVGLLTWFVGIPLVAIGCAFGARYYLDNHFNK